jgi:hypothetical protein
VEVGVHRALHGGVVSMCRLVKGSKVDEGSDRDSKADIEEVETVPEKKKEDEEEVKRRSEAINL